MSRPGIRFIHSGGFHLHRPLHGLAEVPEHLRAVFQEAPYEAARRVFDAVLAEKADFLVLWGDLLDCAGTGPRGPLFLVEQFDRLREHRVPVYWAGGRVDSLDNWPTGIPLPDNVHVFPGRPESLLFESEGRAAAELIGASHDRRRSLRPAMFRPAESGIYRVAVTSQPLERDTLADQPIDFWALGGRHRRGTAGDSSAHAHLPGSPQGRNPTETGAHGCTLVEFTGAGDPRLRFLPTDVVRWHHEKLELDEDTTIDQLRQTTSDRVAHVRSATLRCNTLCRNIVEWHVTGPGPLAKQLRRGPLAEELVAWLRSEYANSEQSVWSSALTVDASSRIAPTEDEQDTLLGEFLRTIHGYQAEGDRPLQWHALAADAEIADTLTDVADWNDSKQRRRIIADAAALGADLLGAPHFDVREGQDG